MKKTVAIIGCGPRGLSALEDLLLTYSKRESMYNLQVIIFERTGCFGSGQVYNPKQTHHNWLNINERSLTIPNREDINLRGESIDGFPSFKDWSFYESDNKSAIDIFPIRALLGTYLEARFNSIAEKLKAFKILKTYQSIVTSVNYKNDRFVITDEKDKSYSADEIVLTIGHQPTNRSKQIAKWKTFEANNTRIKLFDKPYPIKGLFDDGYINGNSHVAIRGFGLAMIDVVRGIAGYTGSRFEIVDDNTQRVHFHPGEDCPKRIIPFSLDGLPMAPKPLNETIDNWFKPSEVQLNHLKIELSKATASPEKVDSIDFIIKVMRSLIAEVFLSLKAKSVSHNYNVSELENLIETYVKHDKTDSDIFISNDLNPKKIIENYIHMATGYSEISLDYCIGQVWRHCQPTLYKYLSYIGFDNEIILDNIKLDEKLKRLTFGPPVASLQQLLALINSGIMSVKAIDDPDIECTDKGWLLEGDNAEFMADVMINSVLDAPKILEVKTPLIKQLLESKYIKPIHEELGVETYKNSIAKSDIQLPIAILGRLAQGTLLGVDAILECFGNRSKVWANDVVNRLEKK
tara:strand:- start:30287 stop:32011 length:1725 start_codon:yes stop_codon:yes gene_type:complete